MYADISKPPAPLPSPQLKVVRPGVSLLPPLSRRGHGPGLIVLTQHSEDPLRIEKGVPSVLVKWAEEGYTVVQIDSSALEAGKSEDLLNESIAILNQCDKFDAGKIGLVAYAPDSWKTVAPALSKISDIAAAIVYTDEASFNAENLDSLQTPVLRHLAGQVASSAPDQTGAKYHYPKATSFAFATPFHEHFHYNLESVSHTRNLQFLKPKLAGPYFDLESIWNEHTYYEFADRSVEHTMSTMVQEPYVNHVPTMTGGIGREKLTCFYRDNFIFNNSADTDLELISRTVGIDRVVDEFIYKCTHDKKIDWLLPGLPPTNVKLEIPFTAVVNIRGDRLYHEHISWDQGTALRQLGLLPEYLPFTPRPVAGVASNTDPSLQYQVPVAGIEAAEKLRDRNSLPSNEMFKYQTKK